MGCWLEDLMAPSRRYRCPRGGPPSPSELRLEARRLRRSCLRASRPAAASSSLSRRSVTCRPSLCIFTCTLTGGLLGLSGRREPGGPLFDIEAVVALPLLDGLCNRFRESCPRDGECDWPRLLFRRAFVAMPPATPAAAAPTSSSRIGGSLPYALDSFAAVLSRRSLAGSGLTFPDGICADPNACCEPYPSDRRAAGGGPGGGGGKV